MERDNQIMNNNERDQQTNIERSNQSYSFGPIILDTVNPITHTNA